MTEMNDRMSTGSDFHMPAHDECTLPRQPSVVELCNVADLHRDRNEDEQRNSIRARKSLSNSTTSEQTTELPNREEDATRCTGAIGRSGFSILTFFQGIGHRFARFLQARRS
eukprot:TRINITY_DN7049_c0_g1_i1.p2 TRINITY_DN7049_c0_g1~~TRINITY_DN7049_c0_g1_i1.p2  ORF type:complete len:122 (-),score=16.88 TRINITY_DN7049_c0_g1_i1:69-404(-)